MGEKDIRTCPDCGREVERSEMLFTKDCHDIPMKLVCYGCHEKRMAKGYDGIYYTEADECLDDDY